MQTPLQPTNQPQLDLPIESSIDGDGKHQKTSTHHTTLHFSHTLFVWADLSLNRISAWEAGNGPTGVFVLSTVQLLSSIAQLTWEVLIHAMFSRLWSKEKKELAYRQTRCAWRVSRRGVLMTEWDFRIRLIDVDVRSVCLLYYCSFRLVTTLKASDSFNDSRQPNVVI